MDDERGVKVASVKIRVTDHAVRRLKQRWQSFGRNSKQPKDDDAWRERLEAIFRASQPAKMSKASRVRRLIDSNFVDALYFDNKEYGMRIIAVGRDGILEIVTVEIALKFN